MSQAAAELVSQYLYSALCCSLTYLWVVPEGAPGTAVTDRFVL